MPGCRVEGWIPGPGLGETRARSAVRDNWPLSLTEPNFVFADVVRESPDGVDSGDDRVYFFFTEVSVEYEFVFKLMIPRVARVCKVSPLPSSPLVPAGRPAHLEGGWWPGSRPPQRCLFTASSPRATEGCARPGPRQPGGLPADPGASAP